MLCHPFPSSCRNWANPSPRPPSSGCWSGSATPSQTGQDIIEVETNKATMNVAAPCPGQVEKLLVSLNESYPVGAVLGYLEASREDAVRLGLDGPAPGLEAEKEAAGPETAGADPSVSPKHGVATDGAGVAGAGQCGRGELHVAPHEGPHGGTGAAGGRSGRPAWQRRGGAGHDPGLREIHRQPGEAPAEPGLLHARGRGRRHAAELDPSACHGGRAGLF